MSLRIFCDHRSHSTQAQLPKAQEHMNASYDAVVDIIRHESETAAWTLTRNGVWVSSLGQSFSHKILTGVLSGVTVELDAIIIKGQTEFDVATMTLKGDVKTGHCLADLLHRAVRDHEEKKRSADEPLHIYDCRVAVSRGEMNSRVNQHVNQTSEHVARMQRIVSAPKTLLFSRHRFWSTKTFDNLCGENVRELKRRVCFFLDNRDWYERKGIPYQLGILLSGPCGTGKTSAIRAIANATKRSIVNVNLTNIATATQLKRLFTLDHMSAFENEEENDAIKVHMPVDKRIFVLDEIDELGDVVAERSTTNSSNKQQSMPDELSLGEMLTLFDGGVEVPGRIIVLLSNYPERIDRALVRPGRIDIHIRFSLASRASLAELFEMIFERPLRQDLVCKLPDEKISPAQASDVFISQMAMNRTVSDETIVESLMSAFICADAQAKPEPK